MFPKPTGVGSSLGLSCPPQVSHASQGLLTYTDEGISSAVPPIRSGLCSSFGGTGVLHGGSGGLTGGRIITGLSPWDRGLGTPSHSPASLKFTNPEYEALLEG